MEQSCRLSLTQKMKLAAAMIASSPQGDIITPAVTLKDVPSVAANLLVVDAWIVRRIRHAEF